MASLEVVPYKQSEKTKKEQVARMFNSIAKKYDFLNHFLSAGIDKRWRRKAIKLVADLHPKKILDVACGTGDFSLEATKLNPQKIVGVDISEEMLNIGIKKIKKKKLGDKINFALGDAENLDFPDGTFNLVMSAFGIRNFGSLETGLSEMYRVLEREGKILILEFSTPKNSFVRWFYYFYFNKLLPFVGKIVSKDKYAYTYLPESVNSFSQEKKVISKLQKIGFTNILEISLSLGIVSIYVGTKK